MNDKIIKTVTEALRSARSIEELAEKLLERGTVFREGREFIRVGEREPLWCEDCAHFRGGPDGEGVCLGDGQPTWYACCACTNIAMFRRSPVSDIFSELFEGIQLARSETMKQYVERSVRGESLEIHTAYIACLETAFDFVTHLRKKYLGDSGSNA